MNHPKISVIIPVRNGAKTIRACLEAIFAQSLPPFEVIVIDGQSIDETKEILKEFPVIIIPQIYGRCGAARQMGLEKAQGEYVAFTDSDCIPSKDWLQNLVIEFNEKIIGVGGGIKNIGEGFWIKSINLSQDTFLGGGGSVQARLLKERRFVKSISGCNSMYRKRDLIDIGGFNVHLTGADETELNYRLLKERKGNLCYTPSAPIMHNHGRNLKEFSINMYRYGGWRRECRVWDLPVFIPILLPFILISIIFNYWIAVGIISLYILAISITVASISIKYKNLKYFISIPIVYTTQYICYTVGFWKEIIIPTRIKRSYNKMA